MFEHKESQLLRLSVKSFRH